MRAEVFPSSGPGLQSISDLQIWGKLEISKDLFFFKVKLEFFLETLQLGIGNLTKCGCGLCEGTFASVAVLTAQTELFYNARFWVWGYNFFRDSVLTSVQFVKLFLTCFLLGRHS